MVVSTSLPVQDDTREKLLLAAHRQFAERGFYGASIALIAGEVGLTKQALLYHFKRKEDLYAEVMRRMAEQLLTAMRDSTDRGAPPEQQFEEIILGIHRTARDNPLNTKVLMRELLDNQRSEAPREEWFFKTFIDELIAALDAVDGMAERSFGEKLAQVYLLVSAIHFTVASGQVLRRFYDDDKCMEVRASVPDELRKLVRRMLANDPA